MRRIILLSTCLLTGLFITNHLQSQITAEFPEDISKLNYYNTYLAPQRGLPQLSLPKPSGNADRKRSILDVGNLVLRFSNAAILGYDRWGLNHQFPAGSEITYYWNMGPLIGGVKSFPDGTQKKSVASGTWGAARQNEGEFEPLPGYDAGIVNTEENIGIAFSDKPASWPATWPSDPYTDAVTGESFNVEPLLDQDHTEGNGLRFPGFLDGKIVGTREAYWVVTDNDPDDGNVAEDGPLDIRVDWWATQFDDALNQDFIIFKQIVTNIGADTLHDVYLGIHGDPDTPEQGGAEWTDDFALVFHRDYQEEMQAQLGYVDSLLFNTLIVYDADDYAEGFLDSKVGWIGFKMLETPINPETGEEFGITTLDMFPYSDAPQGDLAEYAQLASGFEEPHNENPHPMDELGRFPHSYGPDITVAIASGPFDLAPGESQMMSFASILGVNKSDLLDNIKLAQLLHNADYRASKPPEEPQVKAVAEDQKVTFYWDPEPSESSVDPLTGHSDKFQGYRIYKSTDQGKTWGEPITDINGVVQGYVPLAIYDKVDDIEGVNPMNPYLDQGSNGGLRYSFTDTDVINGFEYWYAVCAFDAQDEIVPPMENSRKKNASPGDPFDDNTVAVIPQAKVSGLQQPNIKLDTLGWSTATLDLTVYDQNAVMDNAYYITFEDTTYEYLTFSLYDSTNQRNIIEKSNLLNGEDWNQSFHGMRLTITDEENIAWDEENTHWGTDIPDTARFVPHLEAGSATQPATYQLRFTEKGDTSLFQQKPVPFELWNMRTGGKIGFALYNSPSDSTQEMKDTWTSGDLIVFADTVDGDLVDSWNLRMTSPTRQVITHVDTISDTSYVDIGMVPQTGDTLFIATKRPLTAEDEYVIRTKKRSFDQQTIKRDLKKVRVVPNPYTVTSVYEQTVEVKQIQFTHLPEHSTIRIFNLSGDFIRKLEHRGGSIESWNLRTYNDQEVAFGMYIFVVDAFEPTNNQTSVAQQIGKFAIIK